MRHTMATSWNGNLVSYAAGLLFLATGCTHPNIKTLNAYRNAKESSDYAKASTLLRKDARIWFGKKEGPGDPLTAKGGPYKHWDKEFRSKSQRDRARAQLPHRSSA